MDHVHLKKPHFLLLISMLIFSTFMLITPHAHALFGGKIGEFSADMVELTPDGKVVNTIKLYITPTAVRMDGMPGAGMNPNMPTMALSMFTFKDKDEHYIFNHDKKLYYKTSMDEEGLADLVKDYKDAQQVKKLGTEKVSGYKCTKKEVTSTSTVFGMTHTSTALIWQSDQFEMPLRTKSENGHMTELRNIDKGTQSRSTFKLPSGYKQVDNMMAAMGMDFGNLSDYDDEDDGEDSTSAAPTQTSSQKKTQNDENNSEMTDASKKYIENKLRGLGNKLKNFKFGD